VPLPKADIAIVIPFVEVMGIAARILWSGVVQENCKLLAAVLSGATRLVALSASVDVTKGVNGVVTVVVTTPSCVLLPPPPLLLPF
jgi:hypothetical protein